MKNKLILLIIQLFVVRHGLSQGFVNLDFEAAQITNLVPHTSIIPANYAFPGWTATAPYIFYDDISLSGGSISICDTNPPLSLSPIQGKYFVEFVGSDNPSYGAISLGQTGQVPVGTQSISFWGVDEGIQVSFSGQPLDFVETGSTANYNIYTADISDFAGQNGQLLFTVPLGSSGGFLDNIQFSTQPIPEPSALGLFGMGGLLFAWRRWRNSFLR